MYSGIFVCRALLTCCPMATAFLTWRQEGCQQLFSTRGPGEPPVTEINQRLLGPFFWEIIEGSAGHRRTVWCRALLQGEYRTGPAFAASDTEPVKLNGCYDRDPHIHVFLHNYILPQLFCPFTYILHYPTQMSLQFFLLLLFCIVTVS